MVAGWIGGKWPYQIKFSDKTVLGMPEDKKWVLLAEISDVSLIRNKIVRETQTQENFNMSAGRVRIVFK